MYDVSATGISVYLTASKSFPQGFLITEFADDADPFDSAAMDIATATMNVNGDMVVSGAPNVIPFTLNVIPNSDADKNLAVIFEANRAAKNKKSVKDVITIVGNYPDGSKEILSDGVMTNGVALRSPASAGRIKTTAYSFAFSTKQSIRV